AFSEAATRLDRLLDQRASVDALEIEHDLPSLDLLDIEDVVDEPYQPLTILMRNGEEPQRRLRQRARSSSNQQPQRAGDRGERRAQFMTDGRDEFVLHALV